MQKKWSIASLLGLLILGAGLVPAFAGDSLYGKVTAVKGGGVVTLDYGEGTYDIRIVGINMPAKEPFATQARDLLAGLVLGKNVRIRLEQAEKGLLVSRLFTDDPVLGIKDVGVELVKAGLAQRQLNFDYKYGELAAAEAKAHAEKRGLWSQAQPK